MSRNLRFVALVKLHHWLRHLQEAFSYFACALQLVVYQRRWLGDCEEVAHVANFTIFDDWHRWSICLDRLLGAFEDRDDWCISFEGDPMRLPFPDLPALLQCPLVRPCRVASRRINDKDLVAEPGSFLSKWGSAIREGIFPPESSCRLWSWETFESICERGATVAVSIRHTLIRICVHLCL